MDGRQSPPWPTIVSFPGLPEISFEDFRAQYEYLFVVAPYLRLAKAENKENRFYDCLFDVWFSRWPQTPQNDSESEGMKSIRHRVLQDLVYIAAPGNPALVKITECDWWAAPEFGDVVKRLYPDEVPESAMVVDEPSPLCSESDEMTSEFLNLEYYNVDEPLQLSDSDSSDAEIQYYHTPPSEVMPVDHDIGVQTVTEDYKQTSTDVSVQTEGISSFPNLVSRGSPS